MAGKLAEQLRELDNIRHQLARVLHDTRHAAADEVGALAKVHQLLDVWEEALPPEHAWAVHELAQTLGRTPWGSQQALVDVPPGVRCEAVLPSPMGERCGLDKGHGGPHTTGTVRWYG